jgi:hypothetical protein
VGQNLWQKKGGQLGGSQTFVAPLYVCIARSLYNYEPVGTVFKLYFFQVQSQ